MAHFIESGIPIPETIERSNWPFKNMEIGHSFLLPRDQKDAKFETLENEKRLQRARAAANGVRKSKGWKFTSKWEPAGLRFWRTA